MSSILTAQYILYILMRADIASLNPGKAIAQGAHAANQFMKAHYCDNIIDGRVRFTNADVQMWTADAGSYSVEDVPGPLPIGFGTTITLAVNDSQMRATVKALKALGFRADIVHDPSYPLRDGEFTHYIQLDTCGYVFGDKNKLAPHLRQFSLYP